MARIYWDRAPAGLTDNFVTASAPGKPRDSRVETERFRPFSYAELLARDKVNLDITSCRTPAWRRRCLVSSPRFRCGRFGRSRQQPFTRSRAWKCAASNDAVHCTGSRTASTSSYPQNMSALSGYPRWRRPLRESLPRGFGAGNAVVMGVSTARMHGVIPRAIATAVVATPAQRNAITLADRAATVRFVNRDTARLDAERMTTELGATLVTTPEQTVLDLARRPALGNAEDEVRGAIRIQLARTDPALLDSLAKAQRALTSFGRARCWTAEQPTVR